MTLRTWVYRNLEPSAWTGKGLSPINRVLVLLILLAAFDAVIETEPLISTGHEVLFRVVEIGLGAVFMTEYLARLWVSVENPRYNGSRFPRLRHAVSFAATIDLVAILPTILALGGGGWLVLRSFRILRMVRLAKLGRMSRAWQDIRDAVWSRRFELGLTISLALIAMTVSSTLLYWAEADAQPDKFGSIPRALWWSVVTLTTVGYGDVFPVTPAGKFLSGVVAIVGIGLIALPTGILASAFSDVVQHRRQRETNP